MTGLLKPWTMEWIGHEAQFHWSMVLCLISERFWRIQWKEVESCCYLLGPIPKSNTLPSLKLTNIAPENRPLEKEIPIGNYHLWGLCMLVLGSIVLNKFLPLTKSPTSKRQQSVLCSNKSTWNSLGNHSISPNLVASNMAATGKTFRRDKLPAFGNTEGDGTWMVQVRYP